MRAFAPCAALLIAASGCQFFGGGLPPSAYKSAEAFIDISDRLGDKGTVAGWGGLAAFDYDNDGDIDLLVTNGPGTANRLFQNDGDANFTDVAEEAGVALPDDNCAACAVGDFNNDGRLDLVIARQRIGVPDGTPVGVVLLLNNGPNGSGVVTFTNVTSAQTGLASDVPSVAVGVGDFDKNGLLDLAIGNYDMSKNGSLLVPIYPTMPNELWKCTGVTGGIPQFTKVTTAGIEGTEQNGWDAATSGQTFIPGTIVQYVSDVDDDGYPDLFTLHDIPGGIDYFHNNGDMTFTRLQMDILNKHGGWMGISGADYDGDGDIDYFITNVGSDFNRGALLPGTIASAHNAANGAVFHKLLRNNAGVLEDVTGATSVTPSTVLPPTNALGGSGLEGYEFGFGAAWIDARNAGRQDLYWAGDLIAGPLNTHGVGRFLTSNGDATFTDRTAEFGLFNIAENKVVAFGQHDAGRAAVAVDLNGDGFRDIVITNASMLGTPEAPVRLFLNAAAQDNHWLTVRLTGNASNKFGIGARVTLTVNGQIREGEICSTTSAFAGVQPEVHFGLGDAATIDQVQIIWPSGTITTQTNVAADQVLTVSE